MKHVALIAPIDMNNKARFSSMTKPLGWPLKKLSLPPNQNLDYSETLSLIGNTHFAHI